MHLPFITLAIALAPPPLHANRGSTAVEDVNDSTTLEHVRSQVNAALQSQRRAFSKDAAHALSGSIGIEELVSRNVLATRFEGLALNRCHVAKSTIEAAGNGVFSSRRILAGELVTLYPGDAVKVDAIDETGEEIWSVVEPNGLVRRRPDYSLLERAADYEREVEALGSTSVLGDPKLVDDAACACYGAIERGASASGALPRTKFDSRRPRPPHQRRGDVRAGRAALGVRRRGRARVQRAPRLRARLPHGGGRVAGPLRGRGALHVVRRALLDLAPGLVGDRVRGADAGGLLARGRRGVRVRAAPHPPRLEARPRSVVDSKKNTLLR